MNNLPWAKNIPRIVNGEVCKSIDAVTSAGAGGVVGQDFLNSSLSLVDINTGTDVDFDSTFLDFARLDDLVLAAGDYELQLSGFSLVSRGDYNLDVRFSELTASSRLCL